MKQKLDMNFFQTNVRKPSKFMYFLFYHIVFKLVKWKVNLKVRRAKILKAVKGPFIIMFNHASFFDWIYSFPPLYPKKTKCRDGLLLLYKLSTRKVFK